MEHNQGVSGAMPTARATHASHRARILGLGLTVGISIASAGCARCDDPGGLAIYQSMRDHPNEWHWDGFFYSNASKQVALWNNDLWIWEPPNPFTTIGCRAAIGEVAAPIRDRSRREDSAELAAEVSAIAMETRRAETGNTDSVAKP